MKNGVLVETLSCGSLGTEIHIRTNVESVTACLLLTVFMSPEINACAEWRKSN